MRGQEDDGKAQYLHSEITFERDEYAYHHKFRLAEAQNEPHQGTAPPNVMESDDHMHIDESPAVAHSNERMAPRRRNLTKQRHRKLSAEELLKQNLALYTLRLGRLSSEPCSNPHLRVYHFFRKSRTFAFGTAYINSERGSKALFTVLWQSQTRPRKAVCVTFCLQDSIPASSRQHDRVAARRETLKATCTCCHLVSQSKGCDNGCYHAQACFSNQHFLDYVHLEIRRTQEVQHLDPISGTLFGRRIEMEQLGESWHYLTVFLERPTSKGKKLARPWMFFMVFDVSMQLFVAVLKIYSKPFQCMLCRLSSERRLACDHEDVCFRACKKVKNDPRGYGLIYQLAILDQGGSDSESDSECLDDEEDSDNDTFEQHRQRSVQVPNIYYPTSFKRNILPCPGEQHYMKVLAEQIDELGLGDTLEFDDRMKVCCPKCRTINTKPRYKGYRRKAHLYTVSQGTPTIYVYDWCCDTCEEVKRFTGRACAIFPGRRHSCYTTEYMYMLLEVICMQGVAFRNAYKFTRLVSRLPSTLKRFVSRVEEDDDAENRSRRRASEAFSAFVRHVDTNSPMMANKLFSCQNCEVSLSKEECKELGVPEEEGKKMKRLKALVIDGTAAGILTELPNFERNIATVPAAKNGLVAVYVLKNAGHRKLIIKLVDFVKESLRAWKRRSVARSTPQSFTHSDNSYMRFWLRNPETYSELESKSRSKS